MWYLKHLLEFISGTGLGMLFLWPYIAIDTRTWALWDLIPGALCSVIGLYFLSVVINA
jgi:hypothetical protein